jgi:hypothetical protein
VQPHPRLVDRLPGGRRRDHQNGGDLVVPQTAELAQHQRAPLPLGQRRQIGSELGEPLAQGERLLQGARRDGVRLVDVAVGATAAREAERLVVRDPEEPRTQRHVGLVTPKGLPRLGHRVVQGIAGVVVVAQDRSAVAIQRLVMTLVDRSERLRVAARRHAT